MMVLYGWSIFITGMISGVIVTLFFLWSHKNLQKKFKQTRLKNEGFKPRVVGKMEREAEK